MIKNLFSVKVFFATVTFMVGLYFLFGSSFWSLATEGIRNPFRSKYLNSSVLKVLTEYEKRNLPPASSTESNDHMGVTRDILYQGRTVTKFSPGDRIYCIGLTFDVFMRACEISAGNNFTLKGISTTNFSHFRHEWYGTDGNQRTKVDALTQRGLGIEIMNKDDARPGDFVQFWRDGSGHSVIFLSWVVDEKDSIEGIYYWSTAPNNSVGTDYELFKGYGGFVNPDKLYIVRAFSP